MTVICDETNNTPEGITAGELNVSIRVDHDDGSEVHMDLPLSQGIELITFVEELRQAEAEAVRVKNL